MCRGSKALFGLSFSSLPEEGERQSSKLASDRRVICNLISVSPYLQGKSPLSLLGSCGALEQENRILCLGDLYNCHSVSKNLSVQCTVALRQTTGNGRAHDSQTHGVYCLVKMPTKRLPIKYTKRNSNNKRLPLGLL